MKTFLNMFFLVILFQSCSMIEYGSTGKIPVYFTYKKNNEYEFKIEGREDFYLFGQLPQVRKVDLDDLLQQEGFIEASKIQIHEFLTVKDMILTGISLGLYTPRSYVVTGRGQRE